MKLFYAKGTGFGRFNFGDELNRYLWDALLPSNFFDDNDDELFVGIGTLLNGNWLPDARKILIAGTGAGIGATPKLGRNWVVCGVRGPLTANALGLSSSLAITDPALLCRSVWPNGLETSSQTHEQAPQERSTSVSARQTAVTKQFAVSYMPHFAEACLNEPFWREVCDRLDVHYIDPTRNVPEVLQDILATEHLLAEAMHGAIVADAYRVPWTAVRTHDDIVASKWQDWALSVALDYSPLMVRRPMYLLNNDSVVRRAGSWFTYAQFKNAVSNARPVLSKDSIVDERESQLLEMVERCRKLGLSSK